jgi:Zn-dependent M28 family amino/carboxypeptidase
VSPGDTICNGATDNAAGVAAVLAIACGIAALPNPPRRSVVLAFWDSEEDELIGSAHYVANPLVPLASTIAYVNFDIQGANLLPSLRNFTFAVGPETGGTPLRALVDPIAAGSALDVRALGFIFGQGAATT